MFASRFIPRTARFAALAAGVLLGACGDATGPTATTGAISGTVSVSPGIQANLSNARVAIYASVADMEADRLVKQTAMQGSGAAYTFKIDEVVPGTYYLDVCLAVAGGLACGEYSTGGGQPSPISVAAGQTSSVSVVF